MEYTEEYIDLKQYWQVLNRRLVPALLVMGGVTVLTAVLTFLQKPVYEATGQVLLKKDSGIASLSSTVDLGGLESLTQDSSPISTEAEIVRSEPLIVKTIQALNLKNSEGEPLKPKQFLKKLSVSNTNDTDILTLSYDSTDPEEAAAVVNTLIDIYQAQNLESNRAQSRAAREFIEDQLPGAEQEVQRLEQAMRRFKERSNVVSLPEEARVAVESIGELQQTLATAKSSLADTESRARALRNELGITTQQGLAVNALSQSPAVQKALADLKEVQSQLATTQSQLQSDHPAVIDLKEQETALKSFLNSQVGQVVGEQIPSAPPSNLQASETQQRLTESLIEAEVQRLGLANQVNALVDTQNSYKKAMSNIPRLEQLQRELERKLTVAQSTYEALLTSWQEFRIAENQNVGNTLVVAPATVPEEPISPKVLLNLVIGVVMGSLLGLGTALLLEAIDSSVKTVREAQALFNLTVLGTIPLLEGAEKVVRGNLDRKTPQIPVRDDPRSATSEAYRMLQANLKFLSSDRPPRVFVVTSSIPQEGKSTVSANLAYVLAELGHKVLIIDADLRRPSQHQIWELPNSTGLSNILVDSASSWEEFIRAETETLDVITAGVIPPNPLRLIDSNRLTSLIDEWSSTYDYVVIDSPPLAVAADSLLVAQKTDGLLMVARPGVLNSESAEAARSALSKAMSDDKGDGKAAVLGLVLNGVIPKNEPDSYYYYYAKEYYSASDDKQEKNGKLIGDSFAKLIDRDRQSSSR